MKLVIDANVLVSAVIRTEGKTCGLLLLRTLELHAPQFLLDEFEEHRQEILEKFRLTDMEFGIALGRLSSILNFVPISDFKESNLRAVEFAPDIDDIPYLALALHLNCPLWSNDKRLKKQARVQILSTHELARLLEEAHPCE